MARSQRSKRTLSQGITGAWARTGASNLGRGEGKTAATAVVEPLSMWLEANVRLPQGSLPSSFTRFLFRAEPPLAPALINLHTAIEMLER